MFRPFSIERQRRKISYDPQTTASNLSKIGQAYDFFLSILLKEYSGSQGLKRFLGVKNNHFGRKIVQ
jgi:hypothetical protein